jgi:hypothetical protein
MKAMPDSRPAKLQIFFCVFTAIFLLPFLFFGFLCWQQRIPGGHDAFQYFTLQYYFLNNAVNSGEIPQWIPTMTHGTIATWWYLIQAGLWQNVTCLFPWLAAPLSFQTVFSIGMLFDELVLLIGVWLLSARYYETFAARIFVTLTAWGSAIWMTQPWHNFHAYYAIPLILHFFHTFWETRQWRYLLLAGHLCAIQALGNLPYTFPVTTLVLCLYALFYMICQGQQTVCWIKTMRWHLLVPVILLLVSLTIYGIYVTGNLGVNEIVRYNMGRNSDGSTTLEGFLNYAQNLNLEKWNELVYRISPAMDFTLYIGLLGGIMAVFGGLCHLRRKTCPLFLTTIILLLFSHGTIIAKIFYYLWPMMKYFRHLSLITPLIKLFLIFIAGCGLEAIYLYEKHRRYKLIWGGIAALQIFFLYKISMITWSLHLGQNTTIQALDPMLYSGIGGLPRLEPLFHPQVLTPRLWQAIGFLTGTCALWMLLPFIRSHQSRRLALLIFCVFQLVDVTAYKLSETRLRTASLPDELLPILQFQDMPYQKRRDLDFWENNPRADILFALPTPDVLYWSTYAFLFKDQVGHILRTEHWLKPMDQFLRIFWEPKGFIPVDEEKLGSSIVTVLKLMGHAEDKVQFFNQAITFDHKHQQHMRNFLAHPEYQGNIPLVIMPVDPANPDHTLPIPITFIPSENVRLNLPYQIRRFDANNLIIETHNPHKNPVWLVISDTWHPYWHATVDGKPTRVYQANIAYKAVRIEAGEHQIHLHFGSWLMNLLQHIWGINALLWVGLVCGLIGKTLYDQMLDSCRIRANQE